MCSLKGERENKSGRQKTKARTTKREIRSQKEKKTTVVTVFRLPKGEGTKKREKTELEKKKIQFLKE